LTIIISIVFAAILVRLIMIPVRNLEDAAQQVILGNLDVKLDIEGKDEVGILAKTFNRMTISLKRATDELKETNEQLEIKSTSLEKQKIETDLKNSELEATMYKLKSTQSQLVESEKMASLGQLTAGIAHEINNPINFVYSSVVPLTKDIEEIKELYHSCKKFNDLPQNHKNLEELNKKFDELNPDYLFSEIQSLLTGIKEGAERTKAIVAGLRNFSRLDENEIKPIDIHEGLDSTLMLLRNKLKTRIEIIKNYGNIPKVECYPGKINQVFMNIINNASQAIENEGKITISTWQENTNIYISIKDDGHGFDETVKSKIFEPFYTTKDVGQGTGLGLAISYGIIENHHGKIEVNSAPGKGSEFIICLPKQYQHQ
jgi:signal transduction histidine kinase